MGKIALKTNIPVTGVVRFVDYYPAKPNPKEPTKTLGPDLGIKGEWDGQGEGTIYVNAALFPSLVESGLVTHQGYDAESKPANLRWVYPGRVKVLREEDGQKKRTSIVPLDAAPAPAASNGNGNGHAPAPTGVPDPIPDDRHDRSVRDYWARQYRLMQFALETAYSVHLAVAPGSADDHAVVATTAHSFYIQANRDRVDPVAKKGATA